MLKIRDNPKEWRKFAGLLAVLAVAACVYFGIRGRLTLGEALLWGGVSVVLLGILLAFPRLVRPLYLGWMTIGHWMGQITGRILLTLMFLLIVIPLGLVLRWMGKDLLQVKKEERATYWEKPRREENLERLF